MIHKFITFVKDVLEQLKDPVNIVIYLIVVALFFSPCIVATPTHSLLTRPEAQLLLQPIGFFGLVPLHLRCLYSLASHSR